MTASFLTGPVTVTRAVHAAFCASPVSHRARKFGESMRRTRVALARLTCASHVTLMVGSGTLANDAVAAQLTALEGPGLILSNGEFGERLIDHARRWNLDFSVERRRWGESFDWHELRQVAQRRPPAWIWAVLTETSTGVSNPLAELRTLSGHNGAALCLDAISAIGLMPVELHGIRFATAVSGKGLAAFPGIAAVFHDGHLARPDRIPRYLDLSGYEAADGVPFTHSSNLLAALECSLSQTNWPRKFESVAAQSRTLRAGLRELSLPPLAQDANAAEGIVTFAIPPRIRTARMAAALEEFEIEIAWQSPYLAERNWMQIALMGENDEHLVRSLPEMLSGCFEQLSSEFGSEATQPRRPAARHLRDRDAISS